MMRDDGFANWVRTLPDQVAHHEQLGMPIRVPDPGTEHGRKLLRTLGAEIEHDELEVTASEWLMLRPAGAPTTPAMRLVADALLAAYFRRNPHMRDETAA